MNSSEMEFVSSIEHNNGEIFLNPNEFKGINKNKTLEENIDILINGINTIKDSEKKEVNVKLDDNNNNNDDENQKLKQI